MFLQTVLIPVTLIRQKTGNLSGFGGQQKRNDHNVPGNLWSMSTLTHFNVAQSLAFTQLTGVLIRSKHRLSDALGPLAALSPSEDNLKKEHQKGGRIRVSTLCLAFILPASFFFFFFFFFFFCFFFFCTADIIAPFLLCSFAAISGRD